MADRSEIVFTAAKRSRKASNTGRGTEVLLCCDDNCERLIGVNKLTLINYSNYFRSILSLSPFSASKKRQIVILLKDVPFEDLRAIADFMCGKKIRVSRQQLTSLENSARLLQIVELIDLINEQKTLTSIERVLQMANDYTTNNSSRSGTAVSESIANFKQTSNSNDINVFNKIWFQESCNDNSNICSEDFGLNISNAKIDALLNSNANTESKASDDSSVYYDCIGEADSQKNVKYGEDIAVEDAIVEVETSSSSLNVEKIQNVDDKEMIVKKNGDDKGLSDQSYASVLMPKECSNGNKSIDLKMLHDEKNKATPPNLILLPPLNQNFAQSITPMVNSPRFPFVPSHIFNATSFASPFSTPRPIYSFGQNTPVSTQTQKTETQTIKSKSSTKSKTPRTPKSFYKNDSRRTSKEKSESSKNKRREKGYVCGLCGRQMSWRQSLRVHIFHQHPGNEPNEWILTVE
ncbi:uncharacterized protein B4U79_16117 [Dinothrombium tinctorium]|uniref:Uncharacterized protein n=1 Tax=Dinothrombium tinctorium TaxID=1965070 RepID=A0A3S3P444_9ACAR|nr:uncharacterized protein B4U79_16117 [Dinothrombium tinctorium]